MHSLRASATPPRRVAYYELCRVLPILIGLPPTFAQFSRFFALADHAGLLKEAPTARLRQHPVSLHFLIEAPQQGIERLAVLNDDSAHSLPPPSIHSFG